MYNGYEYLTLVYFPRGPDEPYRKLPSGLFSWYRVISEPRRVLLSEVIVMLIVVDGVEHEDG